MEIIKKKSPAAKQEFGGMYSYEGIQFRAGQNIKYYQLILNFWQLQRA